MREWVLGCGAAGAVWVLLGSLALASLADGPRVRSHYAVGRAQLYALEAGLAMYESDTRRYPRCASEPMADDAAALYTALAAPPSAGGGPNGPYLVDWRSEQVGLRRATGEVRALTPDEAAALSRPRLRGRLGPDELQGDAGAEAFQRRHGPGAEEALVFLDRWGGVIHYREWASRRTEEKEALVAHPRVVSVSDGAGGRHEVYDVPHAGETFDLWSDGPNGIDERGAPCSDDVVRRPRGQHPVRCQLDHPRVGARGGPSGAALLGWGTCGLLALVGLHTTVAGGWRRAAAARAALRVRRRPRVALRRRSGPTRCAFCHGVGGPVAPCGACGTALHLDCWSLSGRCPTLGCRAPACASATPQAEPAAA